MTSLRNVLTAVVLVGLLASYPTAAPRYAAWTAWSAPVNLGPVVNSSFNDQGPAISNDELSLYFSSNRPGGFGGSDIWVSKRTSLEDPWELPINLGVGVNTGNDDAIPALSRYEHYLFFNSNRSGGFGATDIWASYRQDTSDDFGWETPVNLGDGVNSASLDQGAGYFDNDEGARPLLFFGSDRPGGRGMNDIYVSKLRRNRTFGPATRVTELNSPANDLHPSVRSDGLEVFFFSTRPLRRPGLPTSTPDLWTATRKTVFDSWSKPKNLGDIVNSSASDLHPYIASDPGTLYFTSNRGEAEVSGETNDQDLYVTTRVTTRRRQHPHRD